MGLKIFLFKQNSNITITDISFSNKIFLALTDSAGAMVADITSHLPDSQERFTGATPKAGGLVVYTTHVAKSNAAFKPLIAYHGRTALCMVTLEGYPTVNATFVFDVECE